MQNYYILHCTGVIVFPTKLFSSTLHRSNAALSLQCYCHSGLRFGALHRLLPLVLQTYRKTTKKEKKWPNVSDKKNKKREILSCLEYLPGCFLKSMLKSRIKSYQLATILFLFLLQEVLVPSWCPPGLMETTTSNSKSAIDPRTLTTFPTLILCTENK